MKLRKTTGKLLVLSLAAGMTFASCKKGCTDPNATNYDSSAKKDDGNCVFQTWYVTQVTINGETYHKVEGATESNFTFTADKKWLLSGGVFVNNGHTLTVEPGTMIYAADDATTPFLSILQGGKIMADGTASMPIVFTTIKSVTSTPSAGDWGGLVINGYAPINNGSTATGEGGTGTYGGTNSADNSGVLRYVRVEFGGKQLGLDNELNGIALQGVGNGTTLEYVQSHYGQDDGFEFFGGTVNLKYAVSTGAGDDSFDATDGWSGKGQFWVVKQSTNDGDRGIEFDNNGDNNSAAPFTSPMISNITLIGADDGDAGNQGLKLREGLKGNFYNAVVTGFPKRGCQVEHDVTISNMDNGDLTFMHSDIDNTSPFKFTSSTGNDTTVTMMFDDASNMNATATDGTLVNYLGGLNGWTGTNTSTFDPTTLDAWFSAGTFRGAVDANNDWTSAWTVDL